MIAHYGFQDGSGDYFISIDTEKCIACTDKHCIAACPEKILRIFVDDYDDEVVGVAEDRPPENQVYLYTMQISKQ